MSLVLEKALGLMGHSGLTSDLPPLQYQAKNGESEGQACSGQSEGSLYSDEMLWQLLHRWTHVRLGNTGVILQSPAC
jgi:hypothetical protein